MDFDVTLEELYSGNFVEVSCYFLESPEFFFIVCFLVDLIQFEYFSLWFIFINLYTPHNPPPRSDLSIQVSRQAPNWHPQVQL